MLASANQRSGDNDTPHKYSINLLQVELLPKKVWLTLSNVVALWLLVLAVMVGWAIVVHYNQQSITEHLAVVQQENNTNEMLLKALAKQKNKKASKQLITLLSGAYQIIGQEQVSNILNFNQNFNLGFKTPTLGGYPYQISPYKMLEMYNSLSLQNRDYKLKISLAKSLRRKVILQKS